MGIEYHRISWQSDAVSTAISDFLISLLQAVAIVVVVLWLAMGFRVAMIVSFGGLVFVIVGSFLAMGLWGIDLQRMSLGALIIAMGMMVDNAIVVADGIIVRINRGMDRKQAAIEAAQLPMMPLLGATVIAVMAFYPIYASEEGAGEYCRSLFQVVAIALMLSWLLAITVIPLMCMWLIPEPKSTSGDEDEYGGRFYGLFRSVLKKAIQFRFAVVVALLALLGVALYGFQFVDRTFFPDSARLQVMIDYWAPEGTKIQTTSRDMRAIENQLINDERVESVSTFVGQGPPRFYLPVEPEMPYAAYGQFIVNLKDLRGLNQLIPDITHWMDENAPQAVTVVRRYGLGPSETWKVEARISGPAIADQAQLRTLGDEGMEILERSPHNMVARTNWRQQVKKLLIEFSQDRARWSRVTRGNIADTTRRAYDGLPIGQYRGRRQTLSHPVEACGQRTTQPGESVASAPGTTSRSNRRHPACTSDRWPRRSMGKPDNLAL